LKVRVCGATARAGVAAVTVSVTLTDSGLFDAPVLVI
jgi:hypothetical protein